MRYDIDYGVQVLDSVNALMASVSGKASLLQDTEGLIYMGLPDPNQTAHFEKQNNLSVLNSRMGAHR